MLEKEQAASWSPQIKLKLGSILIQWIDQIKLFNQLKEHNKKIIKE